jgi:hypothetical protein
MVNRNPRNYIQPHSIIDKHGLGNYVLELYAKGVSFREISELIWTKHSVKVSTMALSRYVSRDRPDITPNKIGTSLEIVRDSVVRKTIALDEDYTRLFDDMTSIIDNAQIPTKDKNAIKTIVEVRRKTLHQIFIESRAELGLVFEAVMKNEAGVIELLMNFSRNLCPECRGKLLASIKEYEVHNSK